MLDYDAFCDALAEGLGLDRAELGGPTVSLEYLGLDSLQLFELMLILEALGVAKPEDCLLTQRTVADVYDVYVASAAPVV